MMIKIQNRFNTMQQFKMKSLVLKFFFLLIGLQMSIAVLAQKKQRPNVLFIVYDDMNSYGSLNQYAVKMPYLERLKRQAINFRNATCTTPVCNPSRASFLSGLYPHTTGAYLNGADAWDKPQNILSKTESLPECFKRNGYETWGRGKLFHSPLDSAREYEMFDNRPIYKGGFGPQPDPKYPIIAESVQAWQGPDSDFPDVKNADAAIEFLNQPHTKPFFMFYGLWRPHSPYTAPKRFFEMYNPDEIKLPAGYQHGDLNDVPVMGRLLVDSLKKMRQNGVVSEEIWKKRLWGYCANSSFADWNIGRVLEALDKTEYGENTIIILISDNGYQCGEKLRWEKATLWEASDNVPMLVRMPNRKAGVSNRTVSLVDVYPTLVDYCGLIPPSHQLDGRSMVPLLNKPESAWNRPAFTSYGIGYSSVRDERFRFIHYPDGSIELYDHNNDPYEFNNISGNIKYKKVIERLSAYIPKTWAPSAGGKLEVNRRADEYPVKINK